MLLYFVTAGEYAELDVVLVEGVGTDTDFLQIAPIPGEQVAALCNADVEERAHQAFGFGDDIVGMTKLAIGFNRTGGQAHLDIPYD